METKQSFVIIGGAGLIGSALAHALCARGQSVIICDRFGDLAARKWANLPTNLADIWTPESLMEKLGATWRDIAGVIVMADAGHQEGDMDALFEASYHLPRRIWDYCVAKQRPMYWASSMQVYGHAASDLAWDQAIVANLKAQTPLGRAKQAFDHFAVSQGHGPSTPPVKAGFRMASVYGPNETHKGAMASPMFKRAKGKVSGSAEDCDDWVHVDDAACAMVELILRQHSGFFDIALGVSALETLRINVQFRDVEQGLKDLCQTK